MFTTLYLTHEIEFTAKNFDRESLKDSNNDIIHQIYEYGDVRTVNGESSVYAEVEVEYEVEYEEYIPATYWEPSSGGMYMPEEYDFSDEKKELERLFEITSFDASAGDFEKRIEREFDKQMWGE